VLSSDEATSEKDLEEEVKDPVKLAKRAFLKASNRNSKILNNSSEPPSSSDLADEDFSEPKLKG
jgi:hypothetical protein